MAPLFAQTRPPRRSQTSVRTKLGCAGVLIACAMLLWLDTLGPRSPLLTPQSALAPPIALQTTPIPRPPKAAPSRKPRLPPSPSAPPPSSESAEEPPPPRTDLHELQDAPAPPELEAVDPGDVVAGLSEAAVVAAVEAAGGAGGAGTRAAPLLPALAPYAVAQADNPVYVAYGRMLARALAAPTGIRRYVRVQPLSGWGNKLRVLCSGLKLALATGRILLLDDRIMRRFVGPLFFPPFKPLFERDISSLQVVGGDAATRAAGTVQLTSKRNSAVECWARSHDLIACVTPKSGLTPRLLTLVGYYSGDKLIDSSPSLVAGIEAQLGTPLPPRTAWDGWALNALLPAPTGRLSKALASAKKDVGWDGAQLRVGVHMRLFVDYWRRKVKPDKIVDSFWACIATHVSAAQAATGATPANTLIYVASDVGSVRPVAAKKLGPAGLGLGRVVWAGPAKGFVHSETKKNPGDLATVMTDWWLLSETHLLFGTSLSTFGPAAAVKGGQPFVLAEMKKGSLCEKWEVASFDAFEAKRGGKR